MSLSISEDESQSLPLHSPEKPYRAPAVNPLHIGAFPVPSSL